MDRAFSALAEPTRHVVIDQLRRGPSSVSELAARHPMALPSFMKHVDALNETARWIDDHQRMWHTRSDALESTLEKGLAE